MILGLDLSATRTGWCSMYVDDGSMSAYGSWGFSKPKTNIGSRWWKFLNLLRKVHEIEAVTAVAYEKVMLRTQTMRSKNGPAPHTYGSLLGVVEMFAAEIKVPLYPVHISTAKKTAGYGRYSKDEMVAAALKRWNLSIVNHDEADALWVAETARRLINAERE